MFFRRSSEAISIRHQVLRRHLHGLPSQRRSLCLCCFGSWYLFYIRFWKFSLYLEFFAWHFRKLKNSIYSDKTNEMVVKSDTIFFTCEENRIGLVIGYTIFFTCEENRMTNRIASQKKSDDFYSKGLWCVYLSTHIIKRGAQCKW